MFIIREQIRYIGNTTNIKFNLDSNNSLLGLQQEIDNLTQVISLDLVNPPVDIEERRYKNNNTNTINLINFQFTNNGVTYDSSYITAGFAASDITSNSLNKQNSFYIFDFYNSYNINNQTKILTSYVTKIGDVGFIEIKPNNQIYYMYVPVAYINSQLDLGITKITGYTKFSFFNSKTGDIILFYNGAYENLTTPQRMYFTTEINFINKTWKFINSATVITAKQLWNSQDYIKKVNSTYTKFDNQKQNYPKGLEFDGNTGTYI